MFFVSEFCCTSQRLTSRREQPAHSMETQYAHVLGKYVVCAAVVMKADLLHVAGLPRPTLARLELALSPFPILCKAHTNALTSRRLLCIASLQA
jgi:hypothetical protein